MHDAPLRPPLCSQPPDSKQTGTRPGNWIAEFARWCPSIRTARLHGTKDERAQMLGTTLAAGLPGGELRFDVCVTTYEMAIREKAALKKFAWQYANDGCSANNICHFSFLWN